MRGSYYHRLEEHNYYCKIIGELQAEIKRLEIENERLKAVNAGAHMDEMMRR